MEQIVFWELRRRGAQFFFLKNGYEFDFVTVSNSGKINDVIQVCSDLSDSRTLSREIKGISTACKRSGISHGTIITYDKQDQIVIGDITINMIPLPVFIL